jgi:hypothetical protein
MLVFNIPHRKSMLVSKNLNDLSNGHAIGPMMIYNSVKPI